MEQPESILILRERARLFRKRFNERVARSGRTRAVWRVRLPCLERRVNGRTRPCPECATPLQWLRTVGSTGTEYDVYTSCANGCGTFRYDRAREVFVRRG